jgi:hypothetical protein
MADDQQDVFVGEIEDEEEAVRLWHGRIHLARRYQDEHGNTGNRWEDNVKAMAGDFNSLNELGEEAIDVNMVRQTIKTTLTPLWITRPHVTVSARKERGENGEDLILRARKTEVEINYWLNELDVRSHVRDVVLDGEATNHGYLYLGYTRDKQEIEADGVVIENDPLVRHRQPFVRRHPPRHIFVPPGYRNLNECPWIDIMFLKPIRHVRKQFGEERTKDLQPSLKFEHLGIENDPATFTDYLKEEDTHLVEVHNVWDKESKKVYVLAKDHERYLEEPKSWPVELEGFPVAHYSPEDVPDEFYGTPPLTFAMPQQKELNATRTAMRKNRNRAKGVRWVDQEAAREAREAYRNAEDGDMIPIDTGDTGRVGDKMQLDNGIPLDSSDLAYQQIIKDDYRIQSGQSQEQLGSGDPNVDSATASANIQRNAQVRASDKGDRVRKLYLDTSRGLWMILRQFPNFTVTRKVVGAKLDQFRSVTITKEDLIGEFDFDLDFGAMLSDDPLGRQQQSLVNYNMFRADPLINPERLILDVFDSQNKQDPQAYLLNLRQPQQEIQMMLQGLPVESHERDDHERHIAEHDAQGDQLEAAVQRVDPNGPEGQKLRTALILLQTHINDHAAKLQRIQGAQQKPAGSPVAENLLRNQVRVAGGGETNAEVIGQPLRPEDSVQ